MIHLAIGHSIYKRMMGEQLGINAAGETPSHEWPPLAFGEAGKGVEAASFDIRETRADRE
jgi:hypothetical protein